MPRSRRVKIKGEESYYHIISRTVGQEFYLGGAEKEKLVNILKYYSGLYFVKLIGFCIMSNHFHLLIKSEPGYLYDDEEICKRVESYVRRGTDNLSAFGIEKYREKLGDISEYVRAVKQTFSRWYNHHHNRTGYFWGDRFKSVLIEEGETLITCLAYIELNPLRAGMVNIPEEYRWSSFTYRTAHSHSEGFLYFDGIFSKDNLSRKQMFFNYRHFVYKSGNVKSVTMAASEEGRDLRGKPRISDKVYNNEQNRHFVLPKSELMLNRVRYFSDGLVIGSLGFIKEAYHRFGGVVIQKKDRKAYPIGLNNKILSIRKLKVPL